uniref:Uncharacterized protein n=1 Tax=Candidatus Methanogaster sp. ANME-2c ERB4 TaxID=2759911 RepID=A0A7G9Y0F7_9EURY|nr:hypothetical protein PCHDJDJP_00014 [Methanosarcinales archaeon ANME-2c ERB4]QNO42077.1 hypothetical protein NOEFNAIN_00008 [Methanosarcinales archaeon ANME-2c ERB4]QNO42653.1 hypothetical protein LNAFDGMD_00014 [Methanosarcinales archaeon ANME-2c ERB4]QNO43404.1 hypothetical protein PNFJDKBC_00015 [Methanosarcinales archaeon ANME-2c ERB4]QNO48242.1 hypothetical protein BHCKGNAA_00027 [Methanosarcinales archaeon ANME-2c ERB4]
MEITSRTLGVLVDSKLCPLWFSETLSQKYRKVSGVLVPATRDQEDSFITFQKRGIISYHSLSIGSPAVFIHDQFRIDLRGWC